MEVKTIEELNQIKQVSTNGTNPEGNSNNFDSLKLDEPTDIEVEKKSKSSRTKYFVIGLLLTILLIGSYFFLSSFSDSTKKNTIVAKNKDANVSMPGFSPDGASKVLVNDINTNTNAAPVINTAQINANSNSNNLLPGQQGRIQQMPPIEKNPIFGPQNQANKMNVPVTEQVGTNSNSNTGASPVSQVKTNTIPTSTPNPLFNNAPPVSNEGKGSSRTNQNSQETASTGQNTFSNEPIKSSPSQQKSYFLYAKETKDTKDTKDGKNTGVREFNDDSKQNQNVESSLGNKTELNNLQVVEKRPPFGTMLPLQTLGAIDTLGNTPLIRMVLTRTMKGEGWELERGTIFIGRATGGRGNRAYVQVVGYLDAENNALVRIGGDLQGIDGASGLLGDRKKIGSKWSNVIREIGNKAYQTANTWISSRNGSGTNITLPSQTEFGIPNNGNNIEYVLVHPNSFGYFLVNDLPKEIKSESAALPNSNLNNGVEDSQDGSYLPDSEVINLVNRGNPDEIRKALPKIRPEYRKAIIEGLKNKGN